MNRSLPLPLSLLLMFALLGAPALARADLSKKVIATFKGQIVVGVSEMPSGGDDAETIAAIKRGQISEVAGEKNADDVLVWRFSYAAFLNKSGPTSLKMVFTTDDKKQRYAADQRLDGVDPKSPVLVGDVIISEDDGLSRGHSYTVKLVAVNGKKESTLASTKLTMK